MPLDEDILDSTVIDIVADINKNTDQRKKLTALYTRGHQIQLIDVPIPTVADPKKTKKELPLDSILGTTITVERREKECDSLMADYAKLQ